MNTIVLLGRTATDIEMSNFREVNKMTGEVQDNVPMAKFVLAVRRSKEITDFIPCIAFREIAMNLFEYVKKGDQLCINGSLHVNSYTDNFGQSKKSYNVVISKTNFIFEKNKNIEIIEEDENSDYLLAIRKDEE